MVLPISLSYIIRCRSNSAKPPSTVTNRLDADPLGKPKRPRFMAGITYGRKQTCLKRVRGSHVAAAAEFALDVKLRDGRPVGIGLDALKQLVVLEQVETLIRHAEIIEDLHDLAGEA